MYATTATASLTGTAKTRIASLDLLKGLVMVIMALDHIRDYFHISASVFDPADPEQSTLILFFTRWITHFCAPTFSFLAGLSACLVGRRKTRQQLSGFLLKRGLWLVLLEVTVVNFGWYFDVQLRSVDLLVIWALGMSMIVLAGLVYLPKNAILVFSLVLIFGHNLLDDINSNNIFWLLFHQQGLVPLSSKTALFIGYPIVPWIAVMSLGYYFGSFYNNTVTPQQRRKTFNTIGLVAIVLFAVLRATNVYGDQQPYVHYNTFAKNVISFLNPSKYPPSLLYLLMTLGVALLLLANTENAKGKVVNFFSTFGRVPFFYYMLHIYLIHLLAMLFAQLSGAGWQKMILSTWINIEPKLHGYGFSLGVVYAVWIGVIAALYPLCKWFDRYKQNHKDKWWLSYL